MPELAEAKYPCSTVYELIFIHVRSLISANTFRLLWWERSIVDEGLNEEIDNTVGSHLRYGNEYIDDNTMKIVNIIVSGRN